MSDLAMHWRTPKPCEWCTRAFTATSKTTPPQRFCGRSCAAKWRGSQPATRGFIHPAKRPVRA